MNKYDTYNARLEGAEAALAMVAAAKACGPGGKNSDYDVEAIKAGAKDIAERLSMRDHDQDDLKGEAELCVHCSYALGRHRVESFDCPDLMDDFGWSHAWRETKFKGVPYV